MQLMKRWIGMAIVVAALPAVAFATSHQSVGAVMADQEFIDQPGPLGAVTVLGDSVLLGSIITSPTIAQQLSARGWGPIRSRGVAALSSGINPVTLEARASYWVRRWRDEGWDAPNVLINIGANDSGVCDTSVQCARNAILFLVNEIGPGHQIWWPQVTRHSYYEYQAATWNEALRQIDAELDYFYTWDWPLVMEADGYRSSDDTHLDFPGYRKRSDRMATEFTADLARATRTGGDAPLPTSSAPAGEFVPMASTRALDTRLTMPSGVAGGTSVSVDLTELVPDGTTAVTAYVSATNATGDGFLTAFDCAGQRPDTSNVNYLAYQTRGAVAMVPISAGGSLCVFSSATADVLVDVQGAFVPASAQTTDGLRFNPLATPQRLLDTRESVRSHVLTIVTPSGADAVALNITAIAGDEYGFLVAYPCGTEPPTSASVNHLPGDVIAGTAFVPVSDAGTVCVYSLALIDVVVDVTGTFTTGDGLGFVPVAPTRTLDTRFGIGGWSPIHGQGQVVDARVAPPGARAVSGTLTIAFPLRPVFLRAWGCGASPDTSNVNSVGVGAIANSVTTGVDANGRLCVFSLAATGSVFDTSGWWVDVT
ncbi:MAG TPA: SGNH/GDSL hydrolase family protein [Ilumatobacter sp.]|nr:SGNH/GDSL hydrolase family protein [Ilumatobacter sp.]